MDTTDRTEPICSMRWKTLPTVVAATVLLAHASPVRTGEPGDTPWMPQIRELDDALGRWDVAAAVEAWHGARRTAIASRRWEALLDTGDATLWLTEVPAWQPTATARARELYLAAFFRAREEGSVRGMQRSADAFARLGDTQVAEQCLRAARELPAPGASGPLASH
jgi:hypothetical protein